MDTKMQRAKSIFMALVGKVQPEHWNSHLDVACGEDHELRHEIDSLLAAHVPADRFLAQPAAAVVATANASPPVEAVGDGIGRYKLREQIGEGGMGVVYVAQQTEPVRRKVALKIIKPGMASQDVVARFEAERQALAMMDHTNIARVFDGGATDTGQPYFVMELVQGLPITEYCDQQRLSTSERLELFHTVCLAVHHAHQKGIIHRDLKPSNVLVPRIDGAAVPKIIDFGVAKAVSQKLTEQTVYTQFSQLVGTPLYMSPEQAELGTVDIDTRSDVYSLGILLYELLTGCTPFDSKTLKQAGFDEMRRMIREDEPERPSARVSTLDAKALSTISEKRASDPRHLSDALKGELDWIVMKALEKDRNRRYESANSLAEDVERYLRDEPIKARPASQWYRLRKFARRNRALVISSVTVLAALVAGLALATFGLVQAEHRLVAFTAEQENNQELINLLSDMYPRSVDIISRGLNRTVYESMEELSKQLDEGRLRDHPRVEIEVRQIFASSYYAAKEFAKMRDQLYIALDLAIEEYGRFHKIVAEIHEQLAYEISANYGPLDRTRTLRHANQAIEIYESLGIESVRAWYARAASLAAWPARYDEAMKAVQKAVKVAGDYPVFELKDLGNFLMLHGDDRLDEALACFNQALDSHRRSGNTQANIEANILWRKGVCLRRLGDLAAAGDVYLRAYSLFQTPKLRGEPVGYYQGLHLAEVHFAAGEVNRAFMLVSEMEGLIQETPVTLSQVEFLYGKGWLCFQLGDFDTAERELQKAVRIASKEFDETHIAFANPCLQLALTYEAMGRHEDAANQFRRLMPLTRRFVELPFVEPLPYWAHVRAILATCENDPTLLKEAEKTATEGLAHVRDWRRQSDQPSFHLVKAMIQRRRGKNHIELAINELLDGLKKAVEPNATFRMMRKRAVPTSRWELEVTLAEYLVEAGRPDEASECMERAVEIRNEANGLGPDHIQAVLAEIRLGQFLHRQEEYAEAAEQLKRAFEKLKTYSSVLDGVRRPIAQLLVDAYKTMDNREEAATWQSKLQKLDASTSEGDQASLDAASRGAEAPIDCVSIAEDQYVLTLT